MEKNQILKYVDGVSRNDITFIDIEPLMISSYSDCYHEYGFFSGGYVIVRDGESNGKVLEEAYHYDYHHQETCDMYKLRVNVQLPIDITEEYYDEDWTRFKYTVVDGDTRTINFGSDNDSCYFSCPNFSFNIYVIEDIVENGNIGALLNGHATSDYNHKKLYERRTTYNFVTYDNENKILTLDTNISFNDNYKLKKDKVNYKKVYDDANQWTGEITPTATGNSEFKNSTIDKIIIDINTGNNYKIKTYAMLISNDSNYTKYTVPATRIIDNYMATISATYENIYLLTCSYPNQQYTTQLSIGTNYDEVVLYDLCANTATLHPLTSIDCIMVSGHMLEQNVSANNIYSNNFEYGKTLLISAATLDNLPALSNYTFYGWDIPSSYIIGEKYNTNKLYDNRIYCNPLVLTANCVADGEISAIYAPKWSCLKIHYDKNQWHDDGTRKTDSECFHDGSITPLGTSYGNQRLTKINKIYEKYLTDGNFDGIGYEVSSNVLCYDGEKKNILHEIERLRRQSPNILMSIQTHGISGKSVQHEAIALKKNITTGSEEVRAQNHILDNEMLDCLNKFTGNAIVICDCCFGGGIFEYGSQRKAATRPTNFSNMKPNIFLAVGDVGSSTAHGCMSHTFNDIVLDLMEKHSDKTYGFVADIYNNFITKTRKEIFEQLHTYLFRLKELLNKLSNKHYYKGNKNKNLFDDIEFSTSVLFNEAPYSVIDENYKKPLNYSNVIKIYKKFIKDIDILLLDIQNDLCGKKTFLVETFMGSEFFKITSPKFLITSLFNLCNARKYITNIKYNIGSIKYKDDTTLSKNYFYAINYFNDSVYNYVIDHKEYIVTPTIAFNSLIKNLNISYWLEELISWILKKPNNDFEIEVNKNNLNVILQNYTSFKQFKEFIMDEFGEEWNEYNENQFNKASKKFSMLTLDFCINVYQIILNNSSEIDIDYYDPKQLAELIVDNPYIRMSSKLRNKKLFS